MGSFNRNCGLTDLPIYRGEEVYKIYLYKKEVPGVTLEEKEVYHYADDLYTPVSSLISGIYNDYGDIERDTDELIFTGDYQESDMEELSNMLIRKDVFDSLEDFYLNEVEQRRLKNSLNNKGFLRLDRAVPDYIEKASIIMNDRTVSKHDRRVSFARLGDEDFYRAPSVFTFFGNAIGASNISILKFAEDGGNPDDIARIFRLWKILETVGRKFEVVQGGRQVEELDVLSQLHVLSLESIGDIEDRLESEQLY